MVMLDSDKQNFRSIMLGLGELYSKEITKPLLRIYFGALQKYNFEAVSMAIDKHTADPSAGAFMPKPADIIRQIEANTPSVDCRAEMAWVTVERELSRIGAYGTLSMEDKQALAAVKSLGSWRDLCLTPTKDLTWKRKQFIEAYKNFENTPLEELPHHLAGLIEQDRTRREAKKAAGYLTEMKDKLNKRIEDGSN